MKYIKTYENYRTIDLLIENYCSNNIDDKEFENLLYQQLNEKNIFELIKGGLEKMKEWLLSKLKYLFDNMIKVGSKIVNIVKGLLNSFSFVENKNPYLHKVLMTIVIGAMLLVLNANTANAQSRFDNEPTRTERTVDRNDVKQIDDALKYLNKFNSKDPLIKDSKSYLLDLKNSTTQQKFNYAHNAVNMANTIVNTLKVLQDENRTSSDTQRAIFEIINGTINLMNHSHGHYHRTGAVPPGALGSVY